MARTRTVSQNIALFAGLVSATGENGSNLAQIYELQSLDYAWSNPKQDVQIYGLAAPIARETTESPEVTLDFSYLFSNVDVPYFLGFNVDNGAVSILSYILDGTRDEKNYFVFIAPDGQDAVGLGGASSGIGIVGIGNGFINSYSIEGAVGGFPTASVQIQGLNIKTYTGGISQQIPAINPTTGIEITGKTFTVPTVTNYRELDTPPGTLPVVIRPGDIALTLSSAGGIFADYTAPCVQSFNISFDMNRQPIQCLGSRFAASRSIAFPINVNFEVEFLAKDIITGSLSNYLCGTGRYQASLSFKKPSCSGNGTEQIGVSLRNISLEGQQWSSSVGGDPQTLKTTWVGQVGAAGDNVNGLFMSGNIVY